MTSVLEEDWKVFRKLHPELVNRYCVRNLEDLDALLSQPDIPPLDRFQQITELVAEQMKETHFLFDDVRRSTALYKIYDWYRAGLLEDDDIDQFTQEMQQHLDRWARDHLIAEE
jgi:hypothetical protein